MNSPIMTLPQPCLSPGNKTPCSSPGFGARISLMPQTDALKGCSVCVDVWSFNGNDNRSEVFEDILSKLGAEIVKKWTKESHVTHLVFKDGHKSLLQKAKKYNVIIVGCDWVEQCRVTLTHVDEKKHLFKTTSYKPPKRFRELQPLNEEARLQRSNERIRRIKNKEIKKNTRIFFQSPVALVASISPVYIGPSNDVTVLAPNTPFQSQDVTKRKFFSPLVIPESPCDNPEINTEDINLINRDSISSKGSIVAPNTPYYTQPSQVTRKYFSPVMLPETPSCESLKSRLLRINNSPIENPEILSQTPIDKDVEMEMDRNIEMNDLHSVTPSASTPVSNDATPPLRLHLSDSPFQNNNSSLMDIESSEKESDKKIVTNSSKDVGFSPQTNKPNENVSCKNDSIHLHFSGSSDSEIQSMEADGCNEENKSLENHTTNTEDSSFTKKYLDLIEKMKQASPSLLRNIRNTPGLSLADKNNDLNTSFDDVQNREPTLIQPKKPTRRLLDCEPLRPLSLLESPMRSGHDSNSEVDSPIPMHNRQQQRIVGSNMLRKLLKNNTNNNQGKCKENKNADSNTSSKKTSHHKATKRKALSNVTQKYNSNENISNGSTQENKKTNTRANFWKEVHNRRSSTEFQIKKQQKQRQKAKKLVIVLTNFHSKERGEILESLNGNNFFKIRSNVTKDTTHVISGAERRTLSVVNAIVYGIWLLSENWIKDSLEAGKVLDETEYELCHHFPSVKINRVQKQKHICWKNNIFKKFDGILYIADETNPPTKNLEDLIKSCGGSTTRSCLRASLCVGKCEKTFWHNSQVQRVKETWVLDCITENKLLPTSSYIL